MRLLKFLQDRPVLFLSIVTAIVSLCIIGMIIFVLMKLENEKKVAKAALELNRITNSIRAGLVNFIYEDNYKVTYASRAYYDLLGYTKDEIFNMGKHLFLDFVDPRDRETLNKIESQLSSGCIYMEFRMIGKSGEVINILMNGTGEKGKDGKHWVSAVLLDVTEQKHLQEIIQLESERYRVASELSNDILFEYHMKEDYMIYSDKFKDVYGRSPKFPHFYASIGNRRDRIHPDDWGIYLELCAKISSGEPIVMAEFRSKDRVNEFVWCQLMGKTIYDEEKNPIRMIGKVVNVDAQKRQLEALEYKATRDPLTGAYNKEATIKKIEKYITGNKDSGHVLMFIDFDDFKKVNDNYGHLQGDKVLIHIINRIKDVFNEGQIIGRIGGDEFLVFAGNVRDTEEIKKKAEILREALNTVYIDGGKEISISASIGVAVYPEDGINYEQLINCADKALYHIKHLGKKDYMLYRSVIANPDDSQIS